MDKSKNHLKLVIDNTKTDEKIRKYIVLLPICVFLLEIGVLLYFSWRK